MMKQLIWLGIGLVSLAAPAQAAESVPRVVTVQALSPDARPRPVAFARAKAEMSDSATVGSLKTAPGCLDPAPSPISWKRVAPGFSGLKDVFGEELKAAGFKPNQDPGDLFADREATQADLQVGALFKSANIDACESMFRRTLTVRVGIQWQVYSTVRHEVVATIETEEGAQRILGSNDKGQGRSAYQDAFAANVRALLSDPAFRKIVTASAEPAPSATASAAAKTPITLAGATTRPTALSDAVGSVVTIFAGDAFGSGVLVSSDGYLLTNHHVVGGGTTVRVRWSDGLETTGQVIRSDKRRDVALVKTEPRGRTALALNRAVPAAGTPVFAIGAPLDPKLQSTVTRGIVSASRIVNGFSFIQSDTPVTHGNSGGPLLDEHGAVVGLTDWGVEPGQGSSLNFFIPIGDALDFLALTAAVSPVVPPPAVPPPTQHAAVASKRPAKP